MTRERPGKALPTLASRATEQRSKSMSAIETKIAGLLAKAEATPFPAEAEAFMAKAEELMLKYGIELANVQARKPGQKREEIVTVRFNIPNGHGYAAAMAHIAHTIAPNFSIRSLQSLMGDGGRVMWYIGHKSDVEQAERLAQSLMEQSRTQALHWWKTEGKAGSPWATDNDAFLARREFIYAFARGAGSRLEETRAFVVPDGHVHRSMGCSTCYPTTEFGWVTELSGSTEAEIIEAAGSRACTVCYQNAPVDALAGRIFHATEVAAQAARDERAAKKATADAKKATNVIGPYRTSDRDLITTVYAAKAYLTDGFEWGWSHPSFSPQDRDAIAGLLAAKQGTTSEKELEAAIKRAANR